MLPPDPAIPRGGNGLAVFVRWQTFNAQAFLDSAGVSRKVKEFKRAEVGYAQGDAAKSVMYLQEGGVKLSVVSEKQRPPLRGGCVSLKLFQSLWSGLVQVESAVQPGSAAKAAFSLERPCPMKSMAPVLAIV
jgi:hypothetical protein